MKTYKEMHLPSVWWDRPKRRIMIRSKPSHEGSLCLFAAFEAGNNGWIPSRIRALVSEYFRHNLFHMLIVHFPLVRVGGDVENVQLVTRLA
jgi:hypothetical protein